MNILPVSFGMSAIFSKKATQQFVKASSKTTEEKSDAFIKAGENFKKELETSKHVDAKVDKTGIFFPRLKVSIVKKGSRQVLSKVKQSRFNRTSTKIFEEGIKRAQQADKAFDASEHFKGEA